MSILKMLQFELQSNKLYDDKDISKKFSRYWRLLNM